MLFAKPLRSSLVPAVAQRAVTYTTAKQFLRLNADTEQTFVESCLDAATALAEQLAGRVFISRQITAVAPAFETYTRLYGAGCTSLAVHYYNSSNVLTSLSNTNFIIDLSDSVPQLQFIGSAVDAYVRNDAVVFAYTSGYGAIGSVPAALKQAVLMLAAEFYETRSLELQQSSSLYKTALKLISAYALRYF